MRLRTYSSMHESQVYKIQTITGTICKKRYKKYITGLETKYKGTSDNLSFIEVVVCNGISRKWQRWKREGETSEKRRYELIVIMESTSSLWGKDFWRVSKAQPRQVNDVNLPGWGQGGVFLSPARSSSTKCPAKVNAGLTQGGFWRGGAGGEESHKEVTVILVVESKLNKHGVERR